MKHGSIASGQIWSRLFPDFAESDILDDLKALAAGDPNAGGNPILYNFMFEDVAPSMFFAPDKGGLDVVGSGVSTTLPALTPEPSAWTTLLLGAACVALLKRRRPSRVGVR